MSSAIFPSFKSGLMNKVFNLNATDTIKIALMSAYTYNGADTVYGTYGSGGTEVSSGGGYTTGGATMSTAVSTSNPYGLFNTTADVVWTSATFTAIGALIYDTSASNKLIAWIDFGGSQTVAAGTFTVSWSSASPSNCIIQLA